MTGLKISKALKIEKGFVPVGKLPPKNLLEVFTKGGMKQ